jgi:hypothetical protein
MFNKLVVAAAATLALALANPAFAHRGSPSAASELSALSMLPVAVSVVAPVALVVGGATLTVAAVSTVAEGTVWVLERASDGAQASVRLSGDLVVGTSVVVGTAVVVTAISAGTVLSVAGQAVAFIPNEIGKALMYNERITR